MINFIVIPRKNPQTKAVKYYASARTNQLVPLSTLCEQIAEECSLTTADVKACIDRLQRHIRLQLLQGNSVRLDDLGNFRATLSSKGVDTAKDFSAEQMTQVHVRFTPAPKLREAFRVQQVSFGNVTRKDEKDDPSAA